MDLIVSYLLGDTLNSYENAENSRTFLGPSAKNRLSFRTFPGQNKIPGHFQDFQDEWPPWSGQYYDI